MFTGVVIYDCLRISISTYIQNSSGTGTGTAPDPLPILDTQSLHFHTAAPFLQLFPPWGVQSPTICIPLDNNTGRSYNTKRIHPRTIQQILSHRLLALERFLQIQIQSRQSQVFGRREAGAYQAVAFPG